MAKTKRTATDQYFASLPALELSAQCSGWVDDFYDHLRNSGRWDIWKRVHEYYYRGFYRGGKLLKVGKNDEYTSISVNHLRNLLTHMLVMTTNQRPAPEPQATNTDHQSQAQTIVAAGVLDYYNRDKGLDTHCTKGTEHCIVYADSYIIGEWDAQLGQPYATKRNQDNSETIVNTGDIRYENFAPMDVIFDYTVKKPENREWFIARTWKNKWELAAKYPELKDEIIRISGDAQCAPSLRFETWENSQDTENIPVFKFYHKKTAAMPQGRYFEFLTSDVWLFDGGLAYKTLPIHHMQAATQEGSCFGYSVAFDLLPLQELIDLLCSIIATNMATFGVQNIWAPQGSNIKVQQLIDGLNLITGDGQAGAPQALNLLQTPAEIFKFIEILVATMETISGVNSVARGNPEQNLKSGAALALVQSMAIQFNSGLQKAYANLLESTWTGLIQILKDYAKAPMIAAISGKSNRSYLKKFVGNDLADINRVTVNMGNPMARTTAGRVNMADNLLNANMIENPDQYVQVLTTGRVEPLYENKQAELMLIRAENEKLSDGQAVVATIIDNHAEHVPEHKSVLASPEARQDPKIVQNTLAHIQEHIGLWKNADPSLMMLLGQQPAPPPAMPPPPPPAGNSGPAPAAGPMLDPMDPVQAAGQKVKMPSMPKNPLTGQEAEITAPV